MQGCTINDNRCRYGQIQQTKPQEVVLLALLDFDESSLAPSEGKECSIRRKELIKCRKYSFKYSGLICIPLRMKNELLTKERHRNTTNNIFDKKIGLRLRNKGITMNHNNHDSSCIFHSIQCWITRSFPILSSINW